MCFFHISSLASSPGQSSFPHSKNIESYNYLLFPFAMQIQKMLNFLQQVLTTSNPANHIQAILVSLHCLATTSSKGLRHRPFFMYIEQTIPLSDSYCSQPPEQSWICHCQAPYCSCTALNEGNGAVQEENAR